MSLRLGHKFRNDTIQGSSVDCDTDLEKDVYEGLLDCTRINEIQLIGAMVNPLYQCQAKMIAAGRCSEEQYDAGKTELIRRMSNYFARDLDPSDGNTLKLDEYDRTDPKWRVANSPKQRAEDELDLFQGWIVFGAQPTMEPRWTLGVYNKNRQPIKPIYSIGKVLQRGDDYRKGHNLADFVNGLGHFDLVRFFTLHERELPALNSVVLGQIAPHISTEVDCESLFSEAGFLADSRRSRMGVRYYERMVILKHRLQRIYCHIPFVTARFMQRWKMDEWREDDEIEVNEFLKKEREIYLQRFPHNKDMFEGTDEDAEAGYGSIKCDGDLDDLELDEDINNDDDDDDHDDDYVMEGLKPGEVAV